MEVCRIIEVQLRTIAFYGLSNNEINALTLPSLAAGAPQWILLGIYAIFYASKRKTAQQAIR
jgi:hypothetical protein